MVGQRHCKYPPRKTGPLWRDLAEQSFTNLTAAARITPSSLNLRSGARTPAVLAGGGARLQQRAFAGIAGQLRGAQELAARLRVSAQPDQQLAAHARQQVV